MTATSTAMTWLAEHFTGLMWTFAAWAFLIAVAGGSLLCRWRRHEREDAARTEAVLQSLKADNTHLHEMDAV